MKIEEKFSRGLTESSELEFYWLNLFSKNFPVVDAKLELLL